MNEMLKFILTIIMPIAVTLLFTLLERFTSFGKVKNPLRHIVIGACFAVSAVFATLWGLESGSSVLNVRDASPICASFAFGAVPGIISAVIGGAFRFLSAVWWHKGEFSAVACSISTVSIGIIAAFMPKMLLRGRKPSLLFAALFCVLAETAHMLLIFLMNINDSVAAYKAVSSCILPMILLTTLIATVSYGIALTVGGNRIDLFVSRDRLSISDVMERIVIIGMVIAYIFTGVFTYIMQMNSSVSRSENMLYSQLESYMSQIDDACYSGIENDIIKIAYYNSGDSPMPLNDISAENINDFDGDGKLSEADFTELLSIYSMAQGFEEIDLISKDKIIIHSSEKSRIGQSFGNEAFYSGLDEGKSKIEIEVPEDSEYACAGIMLSAHEGLMSDVRYIRFLYTEIKLNETIREYIYESAEAFRFGNAGVMLVLSRDNTDESRLLTVKPINVPSHEELPEAVTFFDPEKYEPMSFSEIEYNGDTQYLIYTEKNELYFLAMLNKDIALLGGRISITIFVLMEAVIFAVVSLFLYYGIRRNIIKNINRVNSDLGRICDGDLDVKIDVDATTEFSELSKDINLTVGTLKKYIEAEAKRIDDELALARTIQTSSLPGVFPPFPGHKEFDIFASMIPAKEVGGDFYDFYFTENGKLAFLIADVSGKGIPAALFMMTARTALKNIAMQGKPIDEVFDAANRLLCEANPSNMFVTAWMGMLNIDNGELQYVNAGHNPPLIFRNGKYEYLKGRTGFVLAALKKSRYKSKSLTLTPGDRVFLYTDGVTEAKSKDNAFYGEDRLIGLLNGSDLSEPKAVCDLAVADVNAFASGCEQADDITVLSLCYHGGDNALKAERSFKAVRESTPEAIAFVFKTLTGSGCPEMTANRFRVCTDEVFSNIVKYAYPDGEGEAAIRIEVTEKKVTVRFTDKGTPFDPLKYKNSEIGLPANKRSPGRLGIFLVKKLMDETLYSDENGENRLTLIKYL